MTPTELLVRVASATVGAAEVPPASNAGPYVERVLARCGTTAGAPWCAAWVADVGSIAVDGWPCPLTASVQVLSEWAEARGVRYIPTGTGQGAPMVGDVFVLWFPKLNRFAHTGIVVGVTGGLVVSTIEGNTNQTGGREGWLVARRSRTLTKADRLIRWTEALV